ncbi:hypothetical protein GCM10007981_08980 [Thermocladium modestius]|uniref:Uncharacterized protein n=1 Tax=Thermocladium modestius TaxID=62609 RepID=A0A830GVH0_9CREN|nr:hypothetical protein GCM10007981_08980 [Thermocladium modestius]
MRGVHPSPSVILFLGLGSREEYRHTPLPLGLRTGDSSIASRSSPQRGHLKAVGDGVTSAPQRGHFITYPENRPLFPDYPCDYDLLGLKYIFE